MPGMMVPHGCNDHIVAPWRPKNAGQKICWAYRPLAALKCRTLNDAVCLGAGMAQKAMTHQLAYERSLNKNLIMETKFF